MSKQSDYYLEEQDNFLREKAYIEAEVNQLEEWLWMEQQQKYDQSLKETKIKIVYQKEKEQLKEE